LEFYGFCKTGRFLQADAADDVQNQGKGKPPGDLFSEPGRMEGIRQRGHSNI
jgi:hypothetical protein